MSTERWVTRTAKTGEEDRYPRGRYAHAAAIYEDASRDFGAAGTAFLWREIGDVEHARAVDAYREALIAWDLAYREAVRGR
ncbi:hypothetical protein BH23GEM4_BH23GEM4_11860 [soil metagenome]